jgi:hypothetical protein
MTQNNINFNIILLVALAFGPLNKLMAQTKPYANQSIENQLNSLCKEIEENYSSEYFTNGNMYKYDGIKLEIEDCAAQNNFININLNCSRIFNDSLNWAQFENTLYKTMRKDKPGQEIPYIAYEVNWKRSISIPIDNIKEIKLSEPEELHLSHQYHLTFLTKSNAIVQEDQPASNFTSSGTIDMDMAVSRIKSDYNNLTTTKINSFTLVLKKDLPLKKRIKKSLGELNKYFDTKEQD